MDVSAALFQIAKRLVVSPGTPDETAEVLLRQVIEATGAERGFIVVRKDESYEQRFDVQFDRATVSAEERRFSRTLVRQAIETREIISSSRAHAAIDLASRESGIFLADRTVVVAPLAHEDEVFAALYLELPHARPEPAIEMFLDELSQIGALAIKRALQHDESERRRRSLERELFAQFDFEGIVTQHPRMRQVLKVVTQVADADATVLVRGETGTGKELIARAIHLNSGRRGKPFVTIHCSALPQTVLESELFGHVRGAFTGADRDRAGRLASANGGTLFLDEVAEIPAELQAKLLRFMQFGEIQRIGSDRVEKVDVRIVAATHQDLAALIKDGRFRQDLYFRLKVIELFVPPLRERRSDIPLLVRRFLAEKWRRPEPARLTPRAERALIDHDYPGNIRELAHMVERACLLATGPDVDAELFSIEPPPAATVADAVSRFSRYDSDELEAAKTAAIAEVERVFLAGLMEKTGGNVSMAARESGIHRSHLQRLLARNRA